MASDITVAALGRRFAPGMLYDAREDKLISVWSLWDHDTLEKYIVENQYESSAFKTSATDTIQSKSSLLDIEASLKASFLSGLVKVEGSAKYLNDTKKFKNQVRVMLQCKADTSCKQLQINNLRMTANQMAIIEKSSATHVVTKVDYGANAVFVFDGEKMEASSIQKIEGSMEAMMNKVSTAVDGKVSVKLDDEEKEETKKFSCTFYGDFTPDSIPTNFEDAVRFCEEFPKLLKEQEVKSVPVKVWLMPLKKLNSKAAEMKTEISDGLMMKVENALEDLREIEIRCKDSLKDSVVKKIPQVLEDLKTFQQLIRRYATNLKQTMAKKLPSIREGKEDERSLEQLFDDREKSPFSNEKLTEWLDHKELEISVIKACVKESGEIKFIRNQSALKREAVGVEHALCFVFTSLENGDPCLDGMTNYFDSPAVQSAHEHQRYYSREVMNNMKEKAEAFQDLAKALKKHKQFRFLMAAIENEKYKGATIYRYKDGGLVTEDFSKPDLPPVRTITDRRDLIWYATDLNLDPDTVNGYLTLSDGNKKATRGSWQNYPYKPQRFDDHYQVLCKEKLEGRHYWEVEWGPGYDESVYVGVVYEGFPKRNGPALGYGNMSWAFGKQKHLYAYHNSNSYVWSDYFPSSGLNRIGVFLDKPAGTLSFYKVSSDRLRHLYTFEATFTEPLYPGLYAYYQGNYAHLQIAE